MEILKAPLPLTVDLSNNGITPVEVATLASALAQATSIVALDLSGNPIGAAGGKCLAECLLKNQSLTSLGLAGTYVGASANDIRAAACAPWRGRHDQLHLVIS